MHNSLQIAILAASLAVFSPSHASDMAKDAAGAKDAGATKEATDTAKDMAKDATATAKEPASTAGANLVDLNGNWTSTEFNTVTLKQTGNKIVGEYVYEEEGGEEQVGEYAAELKGDMLIGTWSEWSGKKEGNPEHAGVVEWKIIDNGKALMGKWRSDGEKEWEGDWNFTKQ